MTTTDLELRRTIATRGNTRIVFLSNKAYGARLGLSVEPGFDKVPGPNGRNMYGYVVGDLGEAETIVAKARRESVVAEHYAIPSIPHLAERVMRGDHNELGLNSRETRILGRVVSSFLDVATTGMGRATHYNSRDEQVRAEHMAHATMLNVDRKTYALLSCLTGLTDNSRKLAAWSLLEWPGLSRPSERELHAERVVVTALARSLTPPRMFQLFKLLADSKCNNSRTRHLILSTLLGSEKLEWWAVKYRRKLRNALKHAWGMRRAGLIKDLCRRSVWSPKEQNILRDNVWRYLADESGAIRTAEAIAFVFDVPRTGGWAAPLFQAYYAARNDLSAGASLPPEVLEGIRSTYHKDVPATEVLRLTARTGAHTSGQQMRSQKAAKAAGVELAFNPRQHDAVKLYVYAYETGMTAAVAGALHDKAKQAAALIPMDLDGAAVLIDASKSMEGSGEQKMRPIASALALSDALEAAGARKVVVGGKPTRTRLVYPAGDTSLAVALVRALQDGATSVYVVSDGYDNAPAGRFAETVQAIRQVGVSTPIYHLNPVTAAEKGSVRELAPEAVPTLPVQNPKAFGTGLLRTALETDPLSALKALLEQGKKALRTQMAQRALPSRQRRSTVPVEDRTASVDTSVLDDLSGPMRAALSFVYHDAERDERGRVQYKGWVPKQTVEALKRRGLVRQVSKTYCYPTTRGQQVADYVER